MTKQKTFRLTPDQIEDLAPRRGACMATDLITVEGQKVGFMYRDEPDDALDSGWRFMSGLETQSYMEDPENLQLYDVNTIANYDPEIIPLLDAPVGSAFERENSTGKFVEIEDFEPED